ncbi:MAG TPA: MSMEG_0567/Sll0786 family nitrogen starvation N-acetyltransferase [Nocardioidaceae bacterium]|nr:MSMEG_0567/Sll0786 family nitrogen starvation N-acetyltransferase [Nocardioidaceae bacterium]
MSTSADPLHAEAPRTPTLSCRQAGSPEALREHRAIRHQVFVLEQGIFAGSDEDERDRDGSTICLLGYYEGTAVGCVRLYELDRRTGLWQGDRLAVLPEYRTSGIGAPLVRCAVATAGSLGGREMLAHIQLPNVRFFSRLGWSLSGDAETYAGLPHQQMRISLPDPARGAAVVEALARGTNLT